MLLNIERLGRFYPSGEYLYAAIIVWPCSRVMLQKSVLLSLLYFKGTPPQQPRISKDTANPVD